MSETRDQFGDRTYGEEWLSFCEAVRLRWEDLTRSMPQAVAAAKLIYARKHAGGHGEGIVIAGFRSVDGKDGAVALVGDFKPAWATYLHDAVEMIQTMEALREQDRPA